MLAALGVALIHAGRTTAGLGALGLAGRLVRASGRPVRFRRASAVWILGRDPEALATCTARGSCAGPATVWAAARRPRGPCSTWPTPAPAGGENSPRPSSSSPGATQEIETAYPVQNRGIAPSGPATPRALSRLDEAAGGTGRWTALLPDLSLDRCGVLLAAGLRRALEEADQAIQDFERVRGQSTKRRNCCWPRHRAALAADSPRWPPGRAGRRGACSARSTGTGGRRSPAADAQRPLRPGRGSGPLLARPASRRRPRRLGSVEAAQAHLLAGRVALPARPAGRGPPSLRPSPR